MEEQQLDPLINAAVLAGDVHQMQQQQQQQLALIAYNSRTIYNTTEACQ